MMPRQFSLPTLPKAERSLPVLFWLPCLLILGLLGLAFLYPQEFSALIDAVNAFVYGRLGTLYLWFVLLILILFVFIGLSPLGAVRLGGKDAVPEHSFFSWFSMLFCAGMGVGFMFWGAAEPLYHFMNPPLVGVVSQMDRESLAFYYTFFHWGLQPWAIYGMTALAISFFGFNLQKGFCFSTFLAGVLERDHCPEWLERVLLYFADIITIVAIVFGIAATLGSGILQIEGGLKVLAGVTPTPALGVLIAGFITIAYLASSFRGLNAGIKLISKVSMWLSFILLACVIWLGPGLKMVWSFFESFPAYLLHLPAMSLGVGSYRDVGWVGEWTVKYWSWWIAWAPFVGLFIALISKGRTVRELILSIMIVPTLFSALWFTAFGNAAIFLQETRHYFGQTLTLNEANTVLFHLMDAYSGFSFLSWLSLALIAIFVINSVDSATYTMACFSLRSMEKQPPFLLQLLWGILFSVLACLLLLTGGIQLLQHVTIAAALPFTLLLMFVFARLFLEMFRYYRTHYHRQDF